MGAGEAGKKDLDKFDTILWDISKGGLAKDPAMKGAVAFLVTVDIEEKSERFNITARKSQMDEIDRRAKRSGMTRPSYIVAAELANTNQTAS